MASLFTWQKILYPYGLTQFEAFVRAADCDTGIAEMVAKLLGYDYDIHYKPGRENTNTDELSQVLSSPSLEAIFVSQPAISDKIKQEVAHNPYMLSIGKLATANPSQPYLWLNGLVCYKHRVVPPNTLIVHQLLHEFHNTPIRGHSGALRTYKCLTQQFYWPSMYQSVK